MHKPYWYIKRILDLLFALVFLVPGVFFITLCYISIKLETHGPAFFFQERPGYKGKLFTIYKLRTMIVDTERDGRLLTDMERLTFAGRIIRSLSLDELPQLYNILRGEMSFIGPRPLLPEYIPKYSAEQMRRHDVLPGISGWAQVNGRNECSWEHKFERDVWYVDHFSFRLDAKIFWLTIANILKRKGINASAGVTMSHFSGNGKPAEEAAKQPADVYEASEEKYA